MYAFTFLSLFRSIGSRALVARQVRQSPQDSLCIGCALSCMASQLLLLLLLLLLSLLALQGGRSGSRCKKNGRQEKERLLVLVKHQVVWKLAESVFINLLGGVVATARLVWTRLVRGMLRTKLVNSN